MSSIIDYITESFGFKKPTPESKNTTPSIYLYMTISIVILILLILFGWIYDR